MGEELRLHHQPLKVLKHHEGLRSTGGLCVRLPWCCPWMWIPMHRETTAARPTAGAPGSSPRGWRRPWGRPHSPVLHLLVGDDGIKPTKSDLGRLAGQSPAASSKGGTWSPSKVTKMGRNSHLIWFICYNDSSPWAILNTSVIFASKTLLQGS